MGNKIFAEAQVEHHPEAKTVVSPWTLEANMESKTAHLKRNGEVVLNLVAEAGDITGLMVLLRMLPDDWHYNRLGQKIKARFNDSTNE